MARPDKAAAVAELVESFQESAGAVLTEYRGLTVKQLQDLRRALGENANYAVVKNTLTKIAATEAGVEGFDDLLTGPTAIAFINGDVVEAAKGLRDFAKAQPRPRHQGRRPRRQAARRRRRSPSSPTSSRVRFSSRKLAGAHAGVAQPGRLPAQRPAVAGRPPRRRAAGEGRAGPVDPRGWRRHAGRRRGRSRGAPRPPPTSRPRHPAEAPAETAEETSRRGRPPRPEASRLDPHRPAPTRPARPRGPAHRKEPPPWRSSPPTSCSTRSRR